MEHKIKESVWLPDGYGKGTIIYDLEGKAWIARDAIMSGIHEVERIDNEVASKLIADGAKVLKSE